MYLFVYAFCPDPPKGFLDTLNEFQSQNQKQVEGQFKGQIKTQIDVKIYLLALFGQSRDRGVPHL